jgi:hypothetical protein
VIVQLQRVMRRRQPQRGGGSDVLERFAVGGIAGSCEAMYMGSEAFPTPDPNRPFFVHVWVWDHLQLPPDVPDVQELDPLRCACIVRCMYQRHRRGCLHDVHVLALRKLVDATQQEEDVLRAVDAPGNLNPNAVVNNAMATLEAHVERQYPPDREDSAPCTRNSNTCSLHSRPGRCIPPVNVVTDFVWFICVEICTQLALIFTSRMRKEDKCTIHLDAGRHAAPVGIM